MDDSGSDFSFKDLFLPLTTKKAIVIIIVTGVIVFFNGLFNSFIADDNGQILENQLVHSITNFPLFFSSGSFAGGSTAGIYYKPVFSIVLSTIYSLFGPIPFFFHSIQLTFHLANVVFLYLLFSKFLNKKFALITSLVFLVHPINSESVIYISDMQEVLYFFFGIASLLLLNKNQLSTRGLIVSQLLLLFSLFSKETGILFWAISIVYLQIFKKTLLKHYLLYSVTTLIIYFIFRFSVAGIFFNKDILDPIMDASLYERLLSAPMIFWYYIKTFFFPQTLLFNQQWVIKQLDFRLFLLPISLDLLFLWLLTVNFINSLKYSRKHSSVILFFSIWFLTGIILHMQIFPLDATVADRWFYFPIVGLLGLLGLSLQNLYDKGIFKKNSLVFLVIAIFILLSLSIRTIVRNSNWHDPITLYTHDLPLMLPNYSLENALAYEYSKQHDLDKALIHAKRSVEIYPTFVNFTNLGALYVQLGEIDKGKEYYKKSIQNNPNYYLTYVNMATLLLKHGNANVARDFINKAAERFPTGEKLRLYQIVAEYKSGNLENALLAAKNYHILKQDAESFAIYSRLHQQLPLNIEIR